MSKKLAILLLLLLAIASAKASAYTGEPLYVPPLDAEPEIVPGLRKGEEENVGIRPTGAPIYSYSSDFGSSLGAHLAVYDFGDGSIKPFKYLYRLQGMVGTNLDTNNYFAFDAPEIFGSKFRFQTRLGFQIIHNYNYFGIGNDTTNVGPSSYYNFKRTTPGIFINVIHPIYKNFKVVFGYLYEQRFIEKAPDSKLAQDDPVGADGGRDSELRVGLAYDSRDNEEMPTKGHFIDAYGEFPIKAFGSSYNNVRMTLTDRNYISIFDRLVWANRVILKTSAGSEVPFYEDAKFGGYSHFDGIGGNATLRGFKQARFIDRSAVIFNEELRLRIFDFYLWKERFDIYTVAFTDFGRVFSSLENFSLNHMHISGGGGVRLCWNKNFVVAPDFGFSKEGYSIYFGFRNVF